MSPFIQHFHAYGGDERDRTDDPLLAKQVLSQLSYTPINGSKLCGVLLTPRTSKIKQRLMTPWSVLSYADLEVSVFFILLAP